MLAFKEHIVFQKVNCSLPFHMDEENIEITFKYGTSKQKNLHISSLDDVYEALFKQAWSDMVPLLALILCCPLWHVNQPISMDG